MRENRRRLLLNGAALGWLVFHLITGVVAMLCGMYQIYDGWSWIFLGLWLLTLLALDAGLYRFGEVELLRSVKWLWGFGAGMYGVMLLLELPPDWTMPDLAALAFVIVSFLTPVHQLGVLSQVLPRGMAGRVLEILAGGLFCLIHFALMTRLHRRAKRREGRGPADLGGKTGK